MKKVLRRFIIINLGLFIMAVGLYLFLVPANLAVGGVTGLAMVIQTVIPSVNLGLLMAVFNVILLTIAFIFIGKEFGGYTIYCSVALSFFIGIFEVLIPLEQAITNDLLLNLIFGIAIQGVGMSLVFYENASTGGTDIVAKILNKFFGMRIGFALFLSDSIITLLAGMAFGIELGLYAFLGILFNGLVIDKVIAGFDTRVHALIISDGIEEISEYIKRDLDRGFTYLSAVGGYSKKEKQVLSVVLSKREYLALRKYINENRQDAFLIVDFVHEVIGNGFNKLV